MDTVLMIYLADISKAISVFIFAIGAIAFVLTLLWLDVKRINTPYHEIEENPFALFYRALPGFALSVFFLLIASLIPSREAIYLMAGAKVTQDIVNDPKAKEIGEKMMKVLNKKLDEM